MQNPRMLDLEVDVATLKQRVGVLEGRLFGRVDDLPGPQPLFDVYSHLILDGIALTEESAAMLRSLILIMSPRILLDLGRMVNDPFPWRPFLAAADLLLVSGLDMEGSIAWLEGIATELLKAQGLGLLRIEDVLRSPAGPVHKLKRFALSETRRST